MKEEELNFIKHYYKWPLGWGDILSRYLILTAPLFFVFLSFMISYFSGTTNSEYRLSFDCNSYLLIWMHYILFNA